MKKLLPILLLAVALPAHANSDFSFTGTFKTDNDIKWYSFTLDSESIVTLRTLSYSGSDALQSYTGSTTNAAGKVIPAGGFDPLITLFDASRTHTIDTDLNGKYTPQGDDIQFGTNASDSLLDAVISATLPKGTYQVAVSEYANGYMQDGHGNAIAFPGFKGVEPETIGFKDYFGNTRTSNYAIDLINVTSAAPVPVPAGIWLLGTALLGLLGIRKKSLIN
jgi:hypothetical protein